MSGDARNIFVTDYTFIRTDKGIHFKTARGRGGIVEDIFIRNIMMKDIQQEAIIFDTYYFMKPPIADEKPEIPPAGGSDILIIAYSFESVINHC